MRPAAALALLLLAAASAAPPPTAAPRGAVRPAAATPDLWAYAVALPAGAGVAVVFPSIAGASPSDYSVVSCPDAACSAPAPAGGAPAPLCAGCPDLVSVVAPAGLGSSYRVSLGGAAGPAASPVVTAIADAASASTAFAAPPPRGAPAPGCGSWATPCASLQDAMDTLGGGGAVWALPGEGTKGEANGRRPRAREPKNSPPPTLSPLPPPSPGTYSGTGNRNLTFRGRPTALASLAGAPRTTLDAGLAARAAAFGPADSAASMTGLTIVHGYNGPDPGAADGGCILIDSSSPALVSLSLSRCTTCDAAGACNGAGGGVAVVNRAGAFGPGGVPAVAPLLASVSVSDSYGADGGGVSFQETGLVAVGVTIDNCHALRVRGERGGRKKAERTRGTRARAPLDPSSPPPCSLAAAWAAPCLASTASWPPPASPSRARRPPSPAAAPRSLLSGPWTPPAPPAPPPTCQSPSARAP